jgi:hypothetical protein
MRQCDPCALWLNTSFGRDTMKEPEHRGGGARASSDSLPIGPGPNNEERRAKEDRDVIDHRMVVISV